MKFKHSAVLVTILLLVMVVSCSTERLSITSSIDINTPVVITFTETESVGKSTEEVSVATPSVTQKNSQESCPENTSVITSETPMETLMSIPESLSGLLITNVFSLDFGFREIESFPNDLEGAACEVIAGYSIQDDKLICGDYQYKSYFYYDLESFEVTPFTLPMDLDPVQIVDNGKSIFAAQRISGGQFATPFYVINRETFEIEREFTAEEMISIPVISESGEYIAYMGLDGVVIESDQSKLIIPDERIADSSLFALAWSPDEKMLAIGVTDVVEPFPPLTGIYVYDFESDQIHDYSDLMDDRLFISFWRVEEDLNGHIGFRFPIWSPDSEMIVLHTYSNEICLLDVSGEDFQCRETGALMKYFTWSPDSSYLAVVDRTDIVNIYEAISLEKIFDLTEQGFVRIIYWTDAK